MTPENPSTALTTSTQTGPKEKKLTPAQKRLVESHVVKPGTHAQLAKRLGMHRVTVTRMLNEEHVLRYMREITGKALTVTAAKAARRLSHLIDKAQSEHVQLGASNSVLEKVGLGQTEATSPVSINVRIDLS